MMYDAKLNDSNAQKALDKIGAELMVLKITDARIKGSYETGIVLWKKGDHFGTHTIVYNDETENPAHVVSLCWGHYNLTREQAIERVRSKKDVTEKMLTTAGYTERMI